MLVVTHLYVYEYRKLKQMLQTCQDVCFLAISACVSSRNVDLEGFWCAFLFCSFQIPALLVLVLILSLYSILFFYLLASQVYMLPLHWKTQRMYVVRANTYSCQVFWVLKPDTNIIRIFLLIYIDMLYRDAHQGGLDKQQVMVMYETKYSMWS